MSVPFVSSRMSAVLAPVALLGAAGCTSLPSNGPTAGAILHRAEARQPDGTATFQVTDLTLASVEGMNAPMAAAGARTLATLGGERRVDQIGPGDVLSITIYEVGVSLFAGNRAAAAAGGGFDPSAHGETFPDTMVDAQGRIDLPYLGPITVAGLTTGEVQQRVVAGLRGKSQDPRALVTIRQNVTNTVYLTGAIPRPGRLALTLGRERLLDAIANAGGSAAAADDTLVRVVRGTQVVEQPLGTIRTGSADDITLVPGDRIELIRRPRTYTALGAANRIAQVPFDADRVSLAEALARVGGPNDNLANPSAIFLFRYDAAADAAGERPVIYRLNLLRPDAYFLAQRFMMRDKDVLYFANASTNQPSKLFSIINQLFTPFITARQIR